MTKRSPISPSRFYCYKVYKSERFPSHSTTDQHNSLIVRYYFAHSYLFPLRSNPLKQRYILNMSVQAYYNIPSIMKAIQIMKDEVEGRTEDKVGRYMSSILICYFPITKYAIVPESRTPDRKIPDFVIEEFLENREFRSRIYVELKSKVGKSIPEAIEQLAASVFLRFGEYGPTYEGYLIVVRGSKIAFLEYYAYFDLEEKSSFLRTIPFNRKIKGEAPQENRPTYSGEPLYKFPDQLRDTYVLDVEKDCSKVHEVFLWMKNNEVRKIDNLINDEGFIRSTPSSRASSYSFSTDSALFPPPPPRLLDRVQSPSTLYRSTDSALSPPPLSLENILVKKTDKKGDSGRELLSTVYDKESRPVEIYTYPGTRSFSFMELDED